MPTTSPVQQKIAYIITRSDIGGAQKHLLSLIDEFHGDYELVLITGSQGFLVESVQALGIKVYIVPSLDSFNVPVVLWKLRGILSSEMPCLVHTHSSLASLYGRVAARLCGFKALYTVHGWHFASEKSRVKWLMKVAVEWLSRCCTDRWITVSKFDEKLGRVFHVFKSGRVDVVVNGVEDLASAYSGGPSACSREALRVIFIGRATYQKNCMAAIDVLELTQEDIRLTVFASGGLVGLLASRIARSPARERIQLILDEPDAGLQLKYYDVLLITSRYEGMPLSVIEAMRAGLPVVSTDVCGMSELIVDGENGGLFAQGDLIGMAAQLDVFAQNRQQLIAMGKLSRVRYMQAFTLDKMVLATREVYQRILSD